MVIRGRVETFPSDAFTQYYTMAVQILYYYDYMLTFPDEVLFPPYPFYKSSPLYRSRTPGRGERRGVSLRIHPVRSVLTELVFWVFIFVNRARSTPSSF